MSNEPLSLDPAFVDDPNGGNLVVNLMDPLVRMNDDLEPEAALAEGWETSDDGHDRDFPSARRRPLDER